MSGSSIAASSGVVAAWVVTALILLLLAALLWSVLRRSGTARTLDVDRGRPGEARDDGGETGGTPADGTRD